ncbi:MAG: GTP-binding protein [Gammaproteobacteria bacterium]|jgi:bifunctional enzyme CysN/CysC
MQEERMNVVIVGHVDHGKSTIIGRLLADTDSLPHGKLKAVKNLCAKNSKPFEYAFLLDALKDEQAQGITIDTARCFFQTEKRKYLILDAPGHIEFLRNMVTGAASAEAALLVIDADEGVQENSCRHGYMLSMLGIKKLVILVNKMDLVNYSQSRFDQVVCEYKNFLKQINMNPISFIPVSGMKGDCIASLSNNLPWYKGDTVLSILDSFDKEKSLEEKPFRMFVQDVYKFTEFGDDRRIIVGKVETGCLNADDIVHFYPSGKKSEVASIELFNAPGQKSVNTGDAAGFVLKEQIYVKRGELISKEDISKPIVSSEIRVSLFWLGKNSLQFGKDYFLKLGSAKVKVRLEKILKVINAASLEEKQHDCVKCNEAAECILKLRVPIAFDLASDNQITSRFVIVDNYDIAGGGIVQQGLNNDISWVRDKIHVRNAHWITSEISRKERADKYGQNPLLIIITGEKNTGRKALAKNLEKELFSLGKKVYFLGIGNVVYGVDADIKGTDADSSFEHLRRFGEVLNILLDAGNLVVVTAIGFGQSEIDLIKETTNCENVFSIWIGDKKRKHVDYDLQLNFNEKDKQQKIIHTLEEHNFL